MKPSPSKVAQRYAASHLDGESYMSVQALQSLKDHAADLLGQVTNTTPLPDWVEAKLTRAAQSINDVYEYMNHGRGQQSQEEAMGGGRIVVQGQPFPLA